jgi:hypothetical protein
MNTQIKTWVGTVVIIIIAITVGAFVWVYEKNQPEIAQPAQVNIVKKANKTADLVPSKVEGWQIYRNEKYGFEFQYPKDWTFTESLSRFNPNSPKNCGPNMTGDSSEPTCLDSIFFTIDQNKEKLPLEKLFEKNGWENGQDYKDVKDFKIGNVTAHEVTLISAYDGMMEDSLYVPLSNGSFFVLQESYLTDGEKNVFNQILSTFKFIN